MNGYASWRILAIFFLCLLMLLFPPFKIKDIFFSKSKSIKNNLPEKFLPKIDIL